MRLTDIAFKHLWRQKAKVLLLLLGIILGVTTIVTLSTITLAMEQEISDKFDQIGSNIVIMPKNENVTLIYGGVTVQSSSARGLELSEDAIEKVMSIKNSENIAAIAPKLLGSVETDGGQALAVGVDFATEFRIKKWWNLQGQEPIADNQIILGSNTATLLKKELGSTLKIADSEFVVFGILNEMGSEEDNVLYISLPRLQKILNKEGTLNYIEVSALCYTCPIEDITEQIAGKLPDAKVTAILEAVEARKVIVDKFSTLARTISAIILLIGLLIVTNSVMASVTGRIREMGIIRALGFKNTHIAVLIIMETITVSLLGGIIGFFQGTVLAKWLAPLIAQMEVVIIWDWQLGLTAVLSAAVVGVIASLIPVSRVIRQNPAHSMSLI
ncbi:MAG: ABC transporter permease [Bacillota bacterium]